MRVVIAGLGVQGRKRLAVAGMDAVATADPVEADAGYRRVEDIPLTDFDAALLCVPDDSKIRLLIYLLQNDKHVLVEKPVVADDIRQIEALRDLAIKSGVACYTAYNHRFEPHIMRMKNLLESGELGEVYLARLFYGNGTARDVRNSAWRDRGAGVLPDLGSHLLDTALYLLGKPAGNPVAWSFNRFENKSFDHVMFGYQGRPVIEMEASLVSWRNEFVCDIYAEGGSAHIRSLCKWGPTIFTRRKRVLPSGRPLEDTVELEQADPTWEAEYRHFTALCKDGGTNLDNDLWINQALQSLAAQSTGRDAA